MSGEISKICQDRGGVKVNKPERITNGDEINRLDDLAQLLKLYQDLSAIDFSTLPDSVIKPLMDLAKKCHVGTSVCYKNALALFVDALEKAKFSAKDRAAVDLILAQVRPVRDAMLRVLNSTSPTVAAKIRDRYYEIEKGIQTGFLHKRALSALKSVIDELALSLTSASSDKLKVKEDGWMDRVKIEDINGVVKLSCQAGIEEATPIIPPPLVPTTVPTVKPEVKKPEEKPPEEFKPKFDFSLRLGVGYGDRVLGTNMSLLSAEDRGGFVNGGASGRLIFTPTLGLQLDYNASGSYDFVKHSDRTPENDNLVSNNDYARLTFFGRPHKNFDFAVNAGWRHYRSDYPTTYNPDVNAFVEGFRINWRPVSNLSLNLDHGLTAGWTSTTYGADKGDFKVASVYGAPGVSYALGPVTPFLGGILGYMNNGEGANGESINGGIYGGYAGAGLKLGGHSADLRGQYIYDNKNSYFDRGLKLMGRYSYGSEAFMVGGAAAYAFDPTGKRHAVTGMLFGDILLKKDSLFGNSWYLSPFFSAGYEQQENDNKKDNTVNLNGGLMVRFGDLRPAVMPVVQPYSTTPLPEER